MFDIGDKVTVKTCYNDDGLVTKEGFQAVIVNKFANYMDKTLYDVEDGNGDTWQRSAGEMRSVD